MVEGHRICQNPPESLRGYPKAESPSPSLLPFIAQLLFWFEIVAHVTQKFATNVTYKSLPYMLTAVFIHTLYEEALGRLHGLKAI